MATAVAVAVATLTIAAAPAIAASRPTVLVTQSSARLGQRLRPRPPLRFHATAGARRVIRIASRPLQRYIGVGGAMTDSSAELIEDQLSPGARRRLLDRLFSGGPRGIGLRFVRVPLGASDFTATGVPYTYRARLMYKPWVSSEEVRETFQTWWKEIDHK